MNCCVHRAAARRRASRSCWLRRVAPLARRLGGRRAAACSACWPASAPGARAKPVPICSAASLMNVAGPVDDLGRPLLASSAQTVGTPPGSVRRGRRRCRRGTPRGAAGGRGRRQQRPLRGRPRRGSRSASSPNSLVEPLGRLEGLRVPVDERVRSAALGSSRSASSRARERAARRPPPADRRAGAGPTERPSDALRARVQVRGWWRRIRRLRASLPAPHDLQVPAGLVRPESGQ